MTIAATPTRRAVFRGIGLTSIAAGLATRAAVASPATARAAPSAAPPAADADAALIRLCAEATRCEDLLREIDAHGTSDEKCNAANDDWDRVFGQIAEIRATTMAGIQAKARVLHLAITREAVSGHNFDCLDNPEAVREHLYPDGLIAWSLAEDVLAVGDAA